MTRKEEIVLAKAPKKIYIDGTTGEFNDHWSIYKNNDSIEYTRTDVFIRKACNWLEFGDFFIQDYLVNDVDGNPRFQYAKFIKDFEKAMEDK